MKSRSRITLSILSLIILSLACNLSNTPVSPPPPTPTLHGDPVMTEAPAVTEEPHPSPLDLPGGVVTYTENTLIVYDLNGTELSRMPFPHQTYAGGGRVHVAGTIGEGVPIMYLSFGDGNETLFFKAGQADAFPLVQGTGFLGLMGASKHPVVAFSQVEYLDTSLRSKLYLGNIQTLSITDPVIVIDDPESWAIRPIMVEEQGGTQTQVWYTRIAYGIGGDIVFEPRKALFSLDYLTRQATTLLDNNLSPWAISKDHHWVAYSAAGTQSNSMCLKNFQTNMDICFPAIPASEPRGAGNGILSPDALYVAWMEGDGYQMAEVPSFKSTIRIGQNNGVILADLPANSFESVAGAGPISRADPVAWLDNQTVVIQLRGQDWDQVRLVRYNVISQETTYLASGEFIGVVYP